MLYAHLITPAAPFQVDLSSRPVEVDYTPAKAPGVFFFLIGFCFCGVSLMAFAEVGGWIKFVIGGAILLIGLMILQLGLRVLFAKRVVRFEDDGVVVTERGLLGKRSRRAGYDEFKGVAVRSFHQSRDRKPTQYYQAVELQHRIAEPIALLVVEGTEPPTDGLKIYARVLGVPMVDT